MSVRSWRRIGSGEIFVDKDRLITYSLNGMNPATGMMMTVLDCAIVGGRVLLMLQYDEK